MLLLAEAHAKLGERGQALEILRPLKLEDPHLQHFAAMTYTALNERAVALELLRKARSAGLPAAELSAWIDLDTLREGPEFPALVR